MPARITIERVLRDADDNTGQSIREWRVESEVDVITVRTSAGGSFLIIRPDDVYQFVADLQRAKANAEALKAEENSK